MAVVDVLRRNGMVERLKHVAITKLQLRGDMGLDLGSVGKGRHG